MQTYRELELCYDGMIPRQRSFASSQLHARLVTVCEGHAAGFEGAANVGKGPVIRYSIAPLEVGKSLFRNFGFLCQIGL